MNFNLEDFLKLIQRREEFCSGSNEAVKVLEWIKELKLFFDFIKEKDESFFSRTVLRIIGNIESFSQRRALDSKLLNFLNARLFLIEKYLKEDDSPVAHWKSLK